jgi:hypothetical protein
VTQQPAIKEALEAMARQGGGGVGGGGSGSGGGCGYGEGKGAKEELVQPGRQE